MTVFRKKRHKMQKQALPGFPPFKIALSVGSTPYNLHKKTQQNQKRFLVQEECWLVKVAT
jgi:hypothetical protein